MEQIKKIFSAKYKRFWLALMFVCLIAAPFVTSNLQKRVMTTIFIYCLLSMGNMLISGHAGMLNMGQAAFYGVGAYVAAIMQLNYGVPFILCFIVAGLGTGLCGFLVSIPCLRLDTDFLSLITTAFSYIFLAIVRNWMSVTRGPMGLTAIPPIKLFGYTFSSATSIYFLLLGIVVVCYILMNNIVNSRIGRAIQATRDDSIGAQSVGVKADLYKVLAFVIGTTLAGFAGALYASYIGYISPNNFVYDTSLTIMQMCIIGGLGSMPGSIIGAAFFVVMPELIRPLAVYRVGVGGIIMIAFMLFRPQGILGSRAFACSTGIQEKLKQKHMEWKMRKQRAERTGEGVQ